MRITIKDAGMGANDLMRAVKLSQHIVTDELSRCTLSMENGFFEMRGRTRVHSIAVDATSARRLQAHWEGFKANQPRGR